MGDRVDVDLTVLKCHAPAVAELAHAVGYQGYKPHLSNGTALFEFNEVNYGDLKFLKDLQTKGIAYESCWGAGYKFTAGKEFCEFDAEGLRRVRTIYDDRRNPELAALLEQINDPHALHNYILAFAQTVKAISWEHQEEYGKRFLARQLIAPGS